jgi:hypothetical protein
VYRIAGLIYQLQQNIGQEEDFQEIIQVARSHPRIKILNEHEDQDASGIDWILVEHRTK